jgi:hypothetical protein
VTRKQQGQIVKFDRASWWGEIDVPALNARVEFHATCYLGATTNGLPSVGDRVRVIYSDATCSRLLSVEGLAP